MIVGSHIQFFFSNQKRSVQVIVLKCDGRTDGQTDGAYYYFPRCAMHMICLWYACANIFVVIIPDLGQVQIMFLNVR